MLNKALVVDDDDLILNFMTTLLQRKFGLRVSTAKDGLEGIEQLKKGGVDVIFLDIMMPKLDGIQFLEMIRSEFRFNHIPVIIISAANNKEIIAKLLKLGIKDYILKPLEFLKITDKLNDIFAEID